MVCITSNTNAKMQVHKPGRLHWSTIFRIEQSIFIIDRPICFLSYSASGSYFLTVEVERVYAMIC